MSLESILKSGTLVEIHYHGDKKANTLIEKSLHSNQLTVLSPLEKSKILSLEIGETVSLVYSIPQEDSKTDFYKVSCIIADKVYVEHLPSYVLELSGAPEKTFRRSAHRVEFLADARLKHLYEGKEIDEHITLLNMSSTGLKAASSSFLPNDAIVYVSFELDAEPLLVKCIVRGSNPLPEHKPQFALRLEFIKENISVDQRINAYLMKKQIEQIHSQKVLAGTDESFTMLPPVVAPSRIKALRNLILSLSLLTLILTFIVSILVAISMPISRPSVFRGWLGLDNLEPTWNKDILMRAQQYSHFALASAFAAFASWTAFKLRYKETIGYSSLILFVFNLVLWTFIGYKNGLFTI